MVTEDEVFIGVTYKQQNNQIKNDLFVSVSKALKFIKFKPSLRSIINHCASSSNKTHTLDLNNNPCIEMRSLKTGYYLVNAFNNQANRVETFVKRPTDSEWLPVSFFDSDDKQGLSLNLNDNFIQMHLEPEGSFNSDPSLPNVIVATAAKDVYLSSDEGNTHYCTSCEYSRFYELEIFKRKRLDACRLRQRQRRHLHLLGFS
jgi:hypothetical protein